MSKETREHLSCLVDGEISRETSRFLIRRLGADEELCATWTRYHLVRDCLRHQDGGLAGEDLCARVSQAIENAEPVKSSRRMPMAWLKPAAGVAVAASVALMAVVAVGPSGMPSPQPSGEQAGNVPVEQFSSPQSLTPAPYTTQASLNGQSNGGNRRMNSYLLRHYQATGATGGKEFVTFVPIVITGVKSPDEADKPSEAADEASDKDEKSKSR
jgi:sigma-E factor negative regulatory protein RseA